MPYVNYTYVQIRVPVTILLRDITLSLLLFFLLLLLYAWVLRPSDRTGTLLYPPSLTFTFTRMIQRDASWMHVHDATRHNVPYMYFVQWCIMGFWIIAVPYSIALPIWIACTWMALMWRVMTRRVPVLSSVLWRTRESVSWLHVVVPTICPSGRSDAKQSAAQWLSPTYTPHSFTRGDDTCILTIVAWTSLPLSQISMIVPDSLRLYISCDTTRLDGTPNLHN